MEGKKKKSRDQLCVNMELKRETFRPRPYYLNMQYAKNIGKVFVVLFFFFFGTAAPLFLSFFCVLDGRSVLPTFQSLVHRLFYSPLPKEYSHLSVRIVLQPTLWREEKTQNATHTHMSLPFLDGAQKNRFRSEQQHVWPGSKSPSQKKKPDLIDPQPKFFSHLSVGRKSWLRWKREGRGREGTFAGRKRVFSSEVSLINILKNCRKRRAVHMLIGGNWIGKFRQCAPSVSTLVANLLQCPHFLQQNCSF